MIIRAPLARRAGLLDTKLAWGWQDADWCLRIRDMGGEVVYSPEATVIHSYWRLTRRRPVSRSSWRQLRGAMSLPRLL